MFLLSIGPVLYWLASMSQFQGITLWISIVLFVGNFGFGSYELWSAVRQPVDFECELTDSKIRCVCPVARMGSTFEIPLDDLIAIEVTGDDTPRIDLLTRNGGRYWLTSNFGNPVRRFVTHLRAFRPHLEYIKR